MEIIKKNDILTHVKKLISASPIIVEAGAFDGRDTLKLSQQWPDGTIHAFEPVPEIFELLTKNTAAISTINRHPLALSDRTGHATLYVSAKPTAPDKPFQAGSLLKPKERLAWSDVVYNKTIEVPTITLDDWTQHNGINRIDFLWLDLQGMELNVLKASPKILSTIRVIYTEVEFIEAYEGQYLYEDVKGWLEKQGFCAVARDFSDQPTWFFGNVLFVRN